jgi:hypothetical protein
MKVTKWSIFNGELTVSDQEAEKIDGETGSLSVSHSAETPNEPVTASAAAGAAKDAAASEIAESGPIASEPTLSEATKVEAVKAEAAAPAPHAEAASEKVSHAPSKVILMPRESRAWTDRDIHVEPTAAEHQGGSGKRRIGAIAAAALLVAAAGALGGGFATASFMHGSNDVAVNGDQAGRRTSLEASLSRLESEVQTLKAGLDHASKLGMNQFNKTTDRLDKLERAQAEPTARLAKLSDAVDKLRAAPVVASAMPAAASASKETTGSIGSAPPQQQAAASTTVAPKSEAKSEAKADSKTEVGRLPTVEGWVLRDVAYGSALIDSRRGTYEVYAGDMIPGLGRVDAIRRQDGRWVVVTSRGLIVAR